MRLKRLQVDGLRCLREVDLSLSGDAVWLAGPNGAGKTSVLEAIALLGFGRSFRGRVGDGLLVRDGGPVQVVAHWIDAAGAERVSGLRHWGDRWEARLDGVAQDRLSALATLFPVLAHHPESSRWVSGPAEERRRLVDWLAFHVEPTFAERSQHAGRALRQRNHLLRAQAEAAEFDFWETALAEAAEAMTAARRAAVAGLEEALLRIWPSLAGTASAPRLQWRAGWREDAASLRDLLYLQRERDRELGYTAAGPHRADLLLGRPFGVESSQCSRGQAKVLALALSLAQVDALRQWNGSHTLLLLDDLRAELDPGHFEAVLGWLAAHGGQVWISGTEPDPRARVRLAPLQVFHVEQGRLHAVAAVEAPRQPL